MFSRFLGFLAPKGPHPPSAKDLEDIKNLDALIKAWQDRAQTLYKQAMPMRLEAAARGIDLDCFWLPPPPGTSQKLHEWMVEIRDLKTLGDELQRLKALKEELLCSELTGSANTILPATCSSDPTASTLRRRHVSQQDEQLMPLLSLAPPMAMSRG